MDLTRFERATSTFAESRSDSTELQVRELAEATGVEPAHAMRGDLANRCHTVRRRLQNCFSQEEVLEEGTGVEPASDKRAVVFGTTALPVRLPFQKGISDCELRISDLLLALCSWPFAVRGVGRDARI